MYLDDLVLLSPNREKADRDYHFARRLFSDLGLPEAIGKTQPPSQRVRWLGVMIDAKQMAISMPEDKIKDVISKVDSMAMRRSTSKTHLQSLIGLILHVSKCVRPARLFVGRLLETLRSMKGRFCNVDAHMRADLRWFQEFLSEWNGVSLIPELSPSREILVDACPSGIGGTDGQSIYAGQVAPQDDPAANITELEAANVVVALHTFIGNSDKGSHVRVWCDNAAAVQVLTTGRGRNKVILECARAVWMLQAVLDVRLTFEHIPGVHNVLADALSRTHLATKFHNIIDTYISKFGLKYVDPCMYFISKLNVLSRSGHTVAAPEGTTTADMGQSTRDIGKQGCRGQNIHSVRAHVGMDPLNPDPQLLCAYLEYIADYIPAPASIRNHMSHIRMHIRLAGGNVDPTKHMYVTMALHAMDRNKEYQQRIKPPILIQLFKDVLTSVPDTHTGNAVKAALLLLYYGVLRQSEVAPPSITKFDPHRHMTRADVTLQRGCLQVNIKWGKNLQKVGQQKSMSLLPADNPQLCPVNAVRHILTVQPTRHEQEPMFMFTDRVPIPITVIKRVWEAALRSMHIPANKYSLHSIRKTAASQASHEGCGDSLIQKYGGWRSSAYLKYIQPQHERVNKALIDSIQSQQ